MVAKKNVQRKAGLLVSAALGIAAIFGCDQLLQHNKKITSELKQAARSIAQLVHHGHAPEKTLSELYEEFKNVHAAIGTKDVARARTALANARELLQELLSTKRMGCVCFKESDPVIKSLIAVIDRYRKEIDEMAGSDAFFEECHEKFWAIVKQQPTHVDFGKKVSPFQYSFSSAAKQLMDVLKKMQNKYPKHPEWAALYLESIDVDGVVDMLASNWLHSLYGRKSITKKEYTKIINEVETAKNAAKEAGFSIDVILDKKIKLVFYHVRVEE